MDQCRTVASPLLTHWRYYNLALSHRTILGLTYSNCLFPTGYPCVWWITSAPTDSCHPWNRWCGLIFRDRYQKQWYFPSTCWPSPLTHICVGGLGQHWFKSCLAACSADSHYTKYCCCLLSTRPPPTPTPKPYIKEFQGMTSFIWRYEGQELFWKTYFIDNKAIQGHLLRYKLKMSQNQNIYYIY